MCIHILCYLHLKCGHLTKIPTHFPHYIPPLKCPEIRRQLYQYHKQPLLTPLQFPLPCPSACPQVWGDDEITGNVYVRPIDWYCPGCSKHVMLHVNPEALIRQGWEVREGDGWREVNILDVTNEDNGVAERLRQDREKEDKMRKDAGQATVVRGWELVQNDKRKRTYTGFPSVALPPWASDFVETEIGTPEHGDEILKREMERLGMFTGGQDTPSLTTSSQVASSGNTSHLQGATATRERKPGVENGRPEVLCPSVFSLQKDTHIVL